MCTGNTASGYNRLKDQTHKATPNLAATPLEVYLLTLRHAVTQVWGSVLYLVYTNSKGLGGCWLFWWYAQKCSRYSKNQGGAGGMDEMQTNGYFWQWEGACGMIEARMYVCTGSRRESNSSSHSLHRSMRHDCDAAYAALSKQAV